MSTDARLCRLEQELRALDPGLPYDEVFAAIVSVARELLGADGMAILLRQDGSSLRAVASEGLVGLRAWEEGLADRPQPGEAVWRHADGRGRGEEHPAPGSLLRAGFTTGHGDGVVEVAFAAHRDPDRDDEALVRLIAHQVGVAVARRTQQERSDREADAARRQVRLWRSLAQLGQAVMRSQDRTELMRQVCEIAVAYGDFRIAWVGERDADGEVRPVAWSGVEEGARDLLDLGVSLDLSEPRGSGPAARALREGVLCTVRDFSAQPEPRLSREMAARFGLGSCAAVPILVSGANAAVLVLYGAHAGEFEDDAVQAVLTEIAQDLGFGLDVLEGRRRRIEAEEQLRLHHEIVEQATECLVVAKVAQDGKVTFVYANPAFEDMTGYRVDEMIGKSSQMLWGPRTDRQAIAAMHDVVLRGESWAGEVYQYRKDGTEFLMDWSAAPLRDEQGRISYILSSHRDITERRKASERIAYLAHHDVLTGLPNRRLLEERILHAMHKARRHGHQFALALIDLDEFKQVNDSLGHSFGDKLLQQLAHRLQKAVRGEDTIARSGGDEFILLVDTVHERQELDHLLGRLVHALEQPCAIAGRTFSLRGSVGVAVYPEDGADADALLRRADIAMYAAKNGGDGSCRYFEPAMEAAVALRGDLRVRLQQAIGRGELELWYQPQVDLAREEVVGLEALLRWRDPEAGLRLPAEFLPAAEGTSLEQEIGRFVLRRAVGVAERLARGGRALQVAINASAREFLAPDFPLELREALARHPAVAARHLTIEITESAAVHDFEQARRQMEECRALGVQIALDDFGTGSSSITLLQELPCDIVKIDQRFIEAMLRTPESPAIIQGILLMGHAMERQVLAEGVETPAQAAALLRLGCHLVQGYGIARPMPEADLDAFLEGFAGRPPLLAQDELHSATEAFQRIAMELGHLRWASLFSATAGQDGSRPYGRHKRLRGTCCGLGYWIETYARSHFAESPALADVEREHAKSHSLVAEAVRLHEAGDLDAAREIAQEIWRQKDDMIMALARLNAFGRDGAHGRKTGPQPEREASP